MVLDWSVPRIVSEMKMRYKYLEDIKKLPEPIDRPSKPDNTIQLKPTVGFSRGENTRMG